MDSKFYEAWFNSEHVVLSRKLHPFCFQDALILSLGESPFLKENWNHLPLPVLRIELKVAVEVCSSPAKKFLQGKLGKSRLARIWWDFCIRKANLEDELLKFSAYLSDYNSGPKFWEEAGGTGLKAPWILANVTHLLRHTTLSLKKIWKMPIGQALWLSATIAEQLGSSTLEFLTEEEEAAMKELGLPV